MEKQIILMACDLCGGKKFTSLFSGRDLMYDVSGTFDLVRCTCGLLFVHPQPSWNVLKKHYPSENYYSLGKKKQYRLKDFLYRTYFTPGFSFWKVLLLPLKPLVRHVHIVPQGRYLDVGCGSGAFPALVAGQGMQAYGVEPGGVDKRYAKDVELFEMDLHKAHFRSTFFDSITMNHVFEHVPNPMKTLRELYRICKKDGKVVVATPQHRNILYSIFGRNWMQLDMPRHLFVYSTRNLVAYAQKAGFVVEKIRYNMTPMSIIGSVLYWSNQFRKKPVVWSQFIDRSRDRFRLKFLGLGLSYAGLLPFCYLFNWLQVGDQVELVLVKK